METPQSRLERGNQLSVRKPNSVSSGLSVNSPVKVESGISGGGTRHPQVVVLGDSNSGKSSLIDQYFRKTFNEKV